jgi:hypothetical protein
MSPPVGGLYLYEVLTESGFLYWFWIMLSDHSATK